MTATFESDYNNGAHPAVLRRFIETNDYASQSYGFDQWSESARKKIRKAMPTSISLSEEHRPMQRSSTVF